jgi:uncharacterized protein (DUF983 family)
LTEREKLDTPVSPFKTGLGCRCPGCGEGKLYNGFLEFAKKCNHCDLDYSEFDSGDGPAVFIILILGFVVVGLALVVEVIYQPPIWVHALLWGPMIIGGSIGMLRPAKGLMVALQYINNAREGTTDDK